MLNLSVILDCNMESTVKVFSSFTNKSLTLQHHRRWMNQSLLTLFGAPPIRTEHHCQLWFLLHFIKPFICLEKILSMPWFNNSESSSAITHRFDNLRCPRLPRTWILHPSFDCPYSNQSKDTSDSKGTPAVSFFKWLEDLCWLHETLSPEGESNVEFLLGVLASNIPRNETQADQLYGRKYLTLS